MSEIPEDVMKSAVVAFNTAIDMDGYEGSYEVIARAILAERERSRTALSEAEQRVKDARREALEMAAKITGSVSESWIEKGSLDLHVALGSVIARIRALLTPSNEVEGAAIGRFLGKLISENPTKWREAELKPILRGWFVGQIMKEFEGTPDERFVRDIVDMTFYTRPALIPSEPHDAEGRE